MSAQPLVFEGPDPEKLLIEAWARHGTSVRISEPECVRTGGIYGFFSKLHYRIEVEPVEAEEQGGPEPTPGVRGASAPLRPRRVTRPEPSRVAPAGGHAGGPPSRPSEPPEEAATRQARTGATAGPTGARTPADRLDELVEATTDVFEVHGSPRRSFDEVLAGVASSLGEDPALVGADLVGRVEPPATDEPPPPARPAAESAAPGGIAAEAAPPGGIEPGAGTAPDARQDAPARALHTGADAASRRVPRHERAGDEARALLSIGVPHEIVERALAAPDAWDLAEAAFAQLPRARALPAVAGALVAIVGELGRALELGGHLADEMGLDDTEVAVATPSRPPCALPPDLVVTATSEADALSPGWRRDRVGIVAVDAASAGASSSWVRQILRALRPSATLAVVSAVSKPEDIGHFAAAIGGVDALVLDDMERTVTPAAATGLGIPIARLGNLAASPAAWSAAVAHLLPAAAPLRVG